MQIIHGSCKKHYGGLRKNLVTDFGLGLNKYPDTIDGAVNALNVAESQLHFSKRPKSPYNAFQFAQAEQAVAGTNGKVVPTITCHVTNARRRDIMPISAHTRRKEETLT
jgi:hypothetical protein